MMLVLLYKMQHNSITSFAEGNVLDVATCMQCLSEKNLKHFAGSQTGSNRAFRRTIIGSGFITSITSKTKNRLQQSGH